MKDSNIFFLGIDGGGTKTEFVLCDSKGKIINDIVTSGCNPNDIGIDKCIDILKNGCLNLCKDINCNNISVFAGIAGISVADYSKRILNLFESLGFYKFGCSSDTKIAIKTTLGKKDGIVVIIGTGVAVIGQKNNEIKTFGGYNYLFDRGGSAFNIGRDAIIYALLCEERQNVGSPLYEAVKYKCNTDTVYLNLKRFYSEGKQYIAQFAHCITDTYQIDTESQNIIDYNMKCITDIINYVQKSYLKTDCIHFVGGLTSQDDKLSHHISKYLDNKCDLHFHKTSIINGALILAGLKENLC